MANRAAASETEAFSFTLLTRIRISPCNLSSEVRFFSSFHGAKNSLDFCIDMILNLCGSINVLFRRTANKSPEKDSLDNDIDEFSQRKKLHQTSLRERASLPEPLPLDFVVHPPSKVNWEEVRARAIRAAMKAKKDKMRRKRRRPFDPLIAQRRRPLFKVQSSAY
ncbi:uncharacterized protein LOC110024135 [Phalaenopsis equestris]|uniref:uncharacterized protein LOC110024135 n=1 Tax=Phalaenopsis equestris TaxID=78828 RepID=UPI0009E4CE6B|nr:uncharacterized protein LOC110024135 [Phalaenopsis equestris]